VDRGYPKDSAVRFISNHHRLADEERFILMRVIVKSDVARIRRSRMQKLEDLKDQTIFIDGYNVLITTESSRGIPSIHAMTASCEIAEGSSGATNLLAHRSCPQPDP